jgi:RluA family pseudouridine synthase
MKEWIVHEEPGFFVLNKPAGVLSQKDKSGEDDLAALLQKDFASAGALLPFLAPVHRLDRNTSGLILLAKTSEAARELTDWLQSKKIQRSYLAIVKGDPGENGRYEFRLRKNEKTNEVFVDAKGDEAVTEFAREKKMGNSSLVRVRLLTGRSHQIRVHFAHAGHALLGDRKYAKKPWSEIFHRPALHSAELELPVEGRVKKFVAEMPKDMRELLKKLGGDRSN